MQRNPEIAADFMHCILILQHGMIFQPSILSVLIIAITQMHFKLPLQKYLQANYSKYRRDYH